MSKTGQKMIRKNIRQVSLDDPIYTRGFVIGGRTSRKSSQDTKEMSLKEELKKSSFSAPVSKETSDRVDKEISDFLNQGIAQEAYAQMSQGSPSEKTDQSSSSTGEKSKGSKS